MHELIIAISGYAIKYVYPQYKNKNYSIIFNTFRHKIMASSHLAHSCMEYVSLCFVFRVISVVINMLREAILLFI